VSGEFLRKLHLGLAVAWIGPGVLIGWWIVYGGLPSEHAAFAILLVSLYANAATHVSAYQAARAETATEESNENQT
jgi:hypothetical protein